MGPLLTGQMPVTADHTVHLSRAQAYCEILGSGQLRGWSEMWGFGVPIGDLYPVLGDLGYCAFKAVGAGAPLAYGWNFAAVMLAGLLSQYWLGRSLLTSQGGAVSAAVGLLAALFWAVDLGAYREGGWNYTVLFGVWPQSLATSLSWLALLALHRAVQDPRRWRGAAVLMASALLAHPMALLHLGAAGLLWALSQRRARSAATCGWTVAIGLGLTAWWWLPMLGLREFMANYGWLHASTRALTRALAQGHFTQHMPAFVGYAGLLGVGACLCQTRRWPKVIAACTVALWLASSRSVFEGLRMDLWGSSWTHLQYQRFLISAKPAYLALAAMGFAMPWLALRRAWQIRLERWRSALLVLVGLLAIGTIGHRLSMDRRAFVEHAEQLGWGQWPTHRLGERYADLDADYAQFVRWAQEQRDQGRTLRFHAKDSRNLHWFMDLPALTGHSVYKSGFTPGDNFRHKPESRHRELLSKLGLTHELRRVAPDAAHREGTLRWGRIELRPIDWSVRRAVIHDAAGQEVQDSGWLSQQERGRWLLEIPEDQAGPLTVALPIAHYARWRIQHQGQTVSSFATPARGEYAAQMAPQAVTPPGRALGNQGDQPTLLSAKFPGPGRYEIIYETQTGRDRLGFWISVLCAGCLVFRRPPLSFKLRLDRVALCALGVLLFALGIQINRTRQARKDHLVRRFEDLSTHATRVKPGFTKSNMVIERALIAKPRQGSPAQFQIEMPRWKPTLRLWWSLHDDWAQADLKPRPHYQIRVWLHGNPEPIFEQTFTHRPNRHSVDLDTKALVGKRATIRVEIGSNRNKSTRIAVDAYPLES